MLSDATHDPTLANPNFSLVNEVDSNGISKNILHLLTFQTPIIYKPSCK